MATLSAFTALGDASFVSLTTFRRTGVPVSTAVWVAGDGDALVVITPDGSGKVKRLRNDGRVELRPCSRSGAVAPGTTPVAGQAEIITDPAGTARVQSLIKKKYGLQYRAFMIIERIAARREKPRVGLRITAV